MQPEKKINLFIVGTAKAGTSFVTDLLEGSQEISIPNNKEPMFFLKEDIQLLSDLDPLKQSLIERLSKNIQEYHELFELNRKYKCDASVFYLYHYDTTIPKIKSYNKHAKIIICLREHHERAESHYNYLQRNIIDFDTLTKSNFCSFWDYESYSNVSGAVDAYLSNFADVLLLDFDDIKSNPTMLRKQIEAFLGVKIAFKEARKNQTQAVSPFGLKIHSIYMRYVRNKLNEKLKNRFSVIFYKLFRQQKSSLPRDPTKYEADKNNLIRVLKLHKRKVPIWLK